MTLDCRISMRSYQPPTSAVSKSVRDAFCDDQHGTGPAVLCDTPLVLREFAMTCRGDPSVIVVVVLVVLVVLVLVLLVVLVLVVVGVVVESQGLPVS
jgi:hypothetical protein